jgi:hypothetical protein
VAGGAGGGVEVGPFGWDQRFGAVWQNEKQMQTIIPMSMPEYRKGLTLEWVGRTNDSRLLGKVVEAGSVWLFPLTV